MELFNILQEFGLSVKLHETLETDNELFEKAMAIIEAGCDVNAEDSFGMTLLHVAAIRSLTLIAEQLIIRGADINAQDEVFGGTPLHHAIRFKNHEFVCMLLSYGADVSIVNRDLMTPLMYAIDMGDTKSSLTLIDFYADFSQTDREGYDALLLATKTRSPVAVNLIEAGVEVDCVAMFNPLVFSLMYQDSKLFKLIWFRDHDQLLQLKTPFLLPYIKCCRFPTSEWLECFYIILSPPDVFKFTMHYNLYIELKLKSTFERISTILRSLYAAFKRRKVPFDDRIKILSLCLSSGMIPEFDDLLHIYNMTRFGDELDFMIRAIDNISCSGTFKCNDIVMLHILGIEPEDPEVLRESIINGFFNEIQMLYRTYPIDDYSDCNIENALRFLVLNNEDKDILVTLMSRLDEVVFESTLDMIKNAPNFPSLQGLCRNRIRNLIKMPNHVPYKFHDKIKSLMLPNILTNVLLFKEPIYSLYQL